MNRLTQTEIIVAHSVAQGFAEKEIADLMFISVHTVHTHARNIRRKWNARNIADVTRMYILSLDDPKLVMKAIVCLMIHVGITLFDAQPDMRRPSSVRSSRISRVVKINNTIHYA